MSKPAEIKKQARRLAQEGKIVDAIRALEELAQGDSVDPYDLVMLGDLCTRGGRAGDATDYYARAVEAYREAALHRNGIALCRKVLRLHPTENRFLLLLGELSEKEGLVLDAVASYLEYAETLDPSEAQGSEPWLEALSRLTPKNVELLTRQAELLVRWGRAAEAATLLRYGADSATTDADRQTLLDMADQMEALGETAPVAELEEVTISEPVSAAGVEADPVPGETFDQAYLRDLSFDPIVDSSSSAAQTEQVTDSNSAPTEPSAPLEMVELHAAEPAVDDEGNAATVYDLDASLAEDGEMPEGFESTAIRPPSAGPAETTPAEVPSLTLDPASATELDEFFGPSETSGAMPTDPASVAESAAGGSPNVLPREDTPVPLDELAAGATAVDPADAAPMAAVHGGAVPAPDAAGLDREALQAALMEDPFHIETQQKLLVCLERDGDSLSALDLRERLAQCLLEDGDAAGALEHYRSILTQDPSRAGVRERFDRLSSEARGEALVPGVNGNGSPASADPASEPGSRSDSLFNVQGLSRVEVKDDPGVTADDMVDLGALLDEFRAGLKEGMADASPRAHYDLGLSHLEMGLFQEAAESFEQACADPAIVPEAQEMWGRCLRELKRTDEAIRVLHAALAARPESLGVRYQLALAHEEAGEVEDAARLHQSIIREDPNFEDSGQRLAAFGGSDCATGPPTT